MLTLSGSLEIPQAFGRGSSTVSAVPGTGERRRDRVVLGHLRGCRHDILRNREARSCRATGWKVCADQGACIRGRCRVGKTGLMQSRGIRASSPAGDAFLRRRDAALCA
jgi:hypothetical protein